MISYNLTADGMFLILGGFILFVSTYFVCYLKLIDLEISSNYQTQQTLVNADYSIILSEIHIHSYNALCCDWNRHCGMVVRSIRNDLNYDVKSFYSVEIENILF